MKMNCIYDHSTSSIYQDTQILQLDGNLTCDSDISSKESCDSNDTTDESLFDSDDEVDCGPLPANLSPIPDQNVQPNQPLLLDVNLYSDAQASCFLPLCLMMNARSVYNKSDNLREMLSSIGPSVTLISETWERENNKLDNVLNSTRFKYISSYRKKKSPGGGCAIVYNERQFNVVNPDVDVPENVEAAWAIFSPVTSDVNKLKVKRILVGTIYVSPKSKYKTETADHIIETIHLLRARYDNDINFLIGGDFNRMPVTDILECYGALKQVVSVPTRKSATLEILLSDLASMYHPVTTLPPLQVDTGKDGKDSDHNVVVFAPRSNVEYRVSRKKKIVTTRPVPQSQILKFESELAKVAWAEHFENKTVHQQTDIFHSVLRENLDKHFPEKIVKISSLDKNG